MIVTYVVIFLIASLSAILSNSRIAVFNDLVRLEFNQKGQTDKEIFNKSTKIILPLILAVGLTFSLTANIFSLFLILWISDLIGLFFKKGIKGIILGALLSGLINCLLYYLINYLIINSASIFNINLLTNSKEIYAIFQYGYVLIPILVIGYHFGVKKSLSAFVILFICYIFINRFIDTVNPSLITMVIGFILYLVIIALNFHRSKMETTFVKNFSSNIQQINRKWFLFSLIGGLISLAIFLEVLSPNIFSLTMQTNNLILEALILSILFSIALLPSLLASTLISGLYSPYGFGFTSIWGLLTLYLFKTLNLEDSTINIIISSVISSLGGALLSYLEIKLIPYLTNMMEKRHDIKLMAEAINKSMFYLLDFCLITGTILMIDLLFIKEMSGLGVIWCLGIYLINRNLKQKFVDSYALGPTSLILLVLIITFFAYLGLY